MCIVALCLSLYFTETLSRGATRVKISRTKSHAAKLFPRLHFDSYKMAEEKKVSPLSASHVNANLVWKRKYLALKKHCQQLEEVCLDQCFNKHATGILSSRQITNSFFKFKFFNQIVAITSPFNVKLFIRFYCCAGKTI